MNNAFAAIFLHLLFTEYATANSSHDDDAQQLQMTTADSYHGRLRGSVMRRNLRENRVTNRNIFVHGFLSKSSAEQGKRANSVKTAKTVGHFRGPKSEKTSKSTRRPATKSSKPPKATKAPKSTRTPKK